MFISTQNASLFGGVALGAVAVRQVFDGTDVSFPGFTQAELIDFWLPAAGALLLLAPGVFPFGGRNKRLIGASIALFIGGRSLLAGNTSFTFDNVIAGHLPALAGVALVA